MPCPSCHATRRVPALRLEGVVVLGDDVGQLGSAVSRRSTCSPSWLSRTSPSGHRVWIDRAVPRGLRAVAAEAGLDPRRALRDMAEADGRP